MQALRVVFGCCLALSVPVAATSVPLPFNGAFRLQIGTLPAITSTGSGVGALGTMPMLGTLTLNIVPEPATALLVGAGLVGLGLARRRYGAP